MKRDSISYFVLSSVLLLGASLVGFVAASLYPNRTIKFILVIASAYLACFAFYNIGVAIHILVNSRRRYK